MFPILRLYSDVYTNRYRVTEPWNVGNMESASYWPVTVTEAMKESPSTAEIYQRPGQWSDFRVRMTTRCGLDRGTWSDTQSKTLVRLYCLTRSAHLIVDPKCIHSPSLHPLPPTHTLHPPHIRHLHPIL